MKSIIVGFSRAKSPWAIGSKIIQETEKRDFSHCYIKYEDALTGFIMVSQASLGMVHECTVDRFLDANISVEEYKIECTDEQFLEFYRFNKLNQGVKYSFIQLIGLAFVKLFHVSQWFKNGDSEFICSEWAARILMILGRPMPDNLDQFTPSDLQKQLILLGIQRTL